MELDVVVADYNRVAKDNERNWGIINESLDQIEHDNTTGVDLTFHIKRIRHLLKSISKFSDFQFHWDTLRNCFENGRKVKMISTSCQTGFEEGRVPVEIVSKIPSVEMVTEPLEPVNIPKAAYQIPRPSLLPTLAPPNPPIDRVIFEQETIPTPVKIENVDSHVDPQGEYVLNVESLAQQCINCQQVVNDDFHMIKHVLERQECQNAVRLIGLNYCLVCQKSYPSVKKAKTHYINFRNPTVNTKERSRTLHRLWFDMLKFPTIRELEESTPSLVHVENSSTGQKCLNCTVTFGSHDGVVDHLESNATCRERYKEEGKTYCVICDKHFENQSKAEIHYRNSTNNGSQAHRLHHKKYFELIRDRKTPGRRSRSSFDFPSISWSSETPTQSFNYSCIICTKSFNDEYDRFNHLSNELTTCHMQFPLVCSTICIICVKDCESEQKLSAHLRLTKNEWHQKYYELFYRKRASKRRHLSGDGEDCEIIKVEDD